MEDSGSVSGPGPARQVQDQDPSLGRTPTVHPSLCAGELLPETKDQVLAQRPSDHPSPLFPGQQVLFQQNQRPLGPVPSPHPQGLTGPLQPPQPRLLVTPQNQNQNQNKYRPLLLMEQPLLIQDLLDKERQEQQQQKHMQTMIRQTSGPEPGFPSMGKTKSPRDQSPGRSSRTRSSSLFCVQVQHLQNSLCLLVLQTLTPSQTRS